MLQLYAAIWRVSGRRQILLIILSIAIAVLAAVPLSYQKDIVNGLTQGSVDRDGLILLCGGMLGMILLSLVLKWLLGYRSGVLGEDVIRLIRRRITHLATTQADTDAQQVPSGTLATMVSAEAEELGKFTGGAFSDPVVQIGTLISVIGYIASTQPGLGAIALMMIFPQIIIVLLTQAQVNRLVAERVRILRRSSNRITAEDLRDIEQDAMADFDRIFETRRLMFVWKLSTKFVLSAINGIGTVAVLLLGGWLVLNGRTDVGTVVAATAGLGRIQGPTGFLIAFYRQVSATRVKFDLLRDIARLPPAPDTTT